MARYSSIAQPQLNTTSHLEFISSPESSFRPHLGKSHLLSLGDSFNSHPRAASSKSMFCSQCGSPLQDAARFCSACGTAVVASSNPASPAQAQAQAGSPSPYNFQPVYSPPLASPTSALISPAGLPQPAFGRLAAALFHALDQNVQVDIPPVPPPFSGRNPCPCIENQELKPSALTL